VKKIVLLFGLVFLLLGSINLVSAEFNVSESHEWLYDQMNSSNWNKPVDDVALAVLSLRNFGYDVSEGIAELESQQLNDDSWGDAYNTALATLALYKTGNNVSSEVEWLLDHRIRAMENGNWLIQLTTGGYATCSIIYDNDSYMFRINNTLIEETGSNWIDFENDVLGSYADVEEEFGVSCIGVTVSPSLIFKTYSNQYYIVDENLPLSIENACFAGSSYNCDCGYTGYAGFVLNSLGENPATYPFLETTCTGDAMGNAFLLDLTGENDYANWLNENQLGGNWGNNKFNTALISYILKNSNQGGASSVSDSIEWMKLQQLQDGSWEGSVKTTAMVLWAMFSNEVPPVPSTTPICLDGILGLGEQCDTGIPCNGGLTCIDCMCVTPQSCTELDACMSDNDCVTGYSCNVDTCSCAAISFGCTSDADCISPEYCDSLTHTCKVLDESPDSTNTTSDDDEEGSNWIAWLIAIIVILIGIGAGYYAYNKYKGGNFGSSKKLPSTSSAPVSKPINPTYPPSTRAIVKPRPSQYRPSRRDTLLESELDKSISKAKDLLKGKK
jgi:hypothetical protein